MKTAKQGSGPVYEDLGRPDAEKMMVSPSRRQDRRDYRKAAMEPQQHAATTLGPTQPKLSQLLRGQPPRHQRDTGPGRAVAADA